jgi:long-chain acyl-CoA synthetase
LADQNKFNALEKPKGLKLLAEPFSVENDMLTPTFKLKRAQAKKIFEKDIDDMYAAPILKQPKK